VTCSHVGTAIRIIRSRNEVTALELC
jgi:hypothetical protein